ncbi:hypothetical protein FOZ76_26195 [Verticiella sediminum]|uniref:Uncharacterized protein n=1 Tax=Verticiella sediminum TaxID=1247510 RepID=A0A556A892_9BURK|nr:hypothetical protein [Verticiella sediminum]TSH89102.1 hypothetical protein FOZ76_26195 [Verticiella sediminum]
MWARISLSLLAALLLAAAAGAWLGQLLVQGAPFGPATPGPGDTTTQISRVGTDGQAQVPEPPQPRVDGTLGVPSRGALTSGQTVPLVSVLEQENRGIAVSGSQPAPDIGAFVANLEGQRQGPGQFNVAPVETGAADAGGQRAELPPELAFAVARPADEPARPAWQESLSASLGRCASQRFFSPAECEQRLRMQYCEPNGGWGRVPECPAGTRNASLR